MQLISGYGVPYNPEPALNRLTSNYENAIEELWENLYHQGPIGTASYAAIPKLVAHCEFQLVAAIEVARHDIESPDIPEELACAYFAALKDALESPPEGESKLQGYYAIHAVMHGEIALAKALCLLSVEDIINEYG